MVALLFTDLQFSIDPSLFLEQASHLPLPTKLIPINSVEEINCLAKVPGGFISGKELHQWNMDGSSVQSLIPSRCRSRRYWINTLRSFPDGELDSGTLDGWMNRWSATGKELWSMPIKDHDVVHCISGDLTSTYVGIGKAVYACASKHFYQGSDQIRCIDVLDDRSLVVGCGPDLEIWKGRDLKNKTFGICESFGSQICAFSRLDSDPNYRTVGFSDGYLRVVDLNVPGTIKIFKEHFSKIRSVTNLSERHFATCSDDSMIKVWDLRAIGSVLTLNPVRATALLKLDENQFISAKTGQIAFWDSRKV